MAKKKNRDEIGVTIIMRRCWCHRVEEGEYLPRKVNRGLQRVGFREKRRRRTVYYIYRIRDNRGVLWEVSDFTRHKKSHADLLSSSAGPWYIRGHLQKRESGQAFNLVLDYLRKERKGLKEEGLL